MGKMEIAMTFFYQKNHISKYVAFCVVLACYLLACSSVPTDLLKKTTDKQEIAQLLFNLPNHMPKILPNVHQNPVKTLDCQTLQSGKTITLTGDNQIPKDCDLWQKNAHFIMENSQTSLDCQGVPIRTTDNNLTAITIRTPKNVATGIRNISVKNCAFVNYRHGILIGQQTPVNVRYQQLLNKKTTLDEQKQLSPNHVLLNRILVADSKNSGIFVGDHVQNTHIINSLVTTSGTVGIYFEFGSGQNSVTFSRFFGNGFRQTNIAGIGVGKPNREAIAIDSSNQNVIANNQFDSNGAGGVFLYRNCFEHADDPTKSNYFLRTQGSDDNQIFDNIFNHEPVGVWVASRQSRNLKGFGCGAYLIKSDVLSSFHLDESEQNLINNNQFRQTDNAIIIEDDNNVVSFNTFYADVKKPITVGSLIREQSSEGVVKGNQINDNTFEKSSDIIHLIDFIGKSKNQNLHCNNFDKNKQKLDNQCLVN